MFGYIRPFKPHMRFFEYEIYSSFYCGLCKNLGKNYGQVFRLLLSYDFTFLGLLYNAYHSRCGEIEKRRCIVHPFKRRSCLCCSDNQEYTSAAAVISVYHKICDEIQDRGVLTSLFFRFVRKLMKKGYRRAAEKLPQVAETVEYYMKAQSEIERENCSSIDRACDPTARIMSCIAGSIADDSTDRENLSGFGYHLGRFIYLADAHDDIEKDKKNGNYNPLLLNFDRIDEAKRFAVENINLSLGQASEFYSRLNIVKFREILDNVVYLGLPNFRLFNKKELNRKRNDIVRI
ncbi:MAG: DUF5685 family protein [Porcipelethomonas sp.]